MGWKNGHRIVDLHELAKQMYCQKCKSTLDLNRTGEEIQIGLASVLVIACFCGARNRVHTTRRLSSDNGRTIYAVNSQAVTYIEKTNMPIRKLNNFFTELHIPGFLASRKQLSVFRSTADVSDRPFTSANLCDTEICNAITVSNEPAPTTQHSQFQTNTDLGEETKQDVTEEHHVSGQCSNQDGFNSKHTEGERIRIQTSVKQQKNGQFSNQTESDSIDGGEMQNVADERGITRQCTEQLKLKCTVDKERTRKSTLSETVLSENMHDVAEKKEKEEGNLSTSVMCESVNGTVVDESVNGTMVGESVNGTVVDESVNGTVVDVSVDGTVVDVSVDGCQDVSVDGTVVDVSVDGCQDVSVDGTVVDVSVDGCQDVSVDGTVVDVSVDGCQDVSVDGMVVDVSVDGTMVDVDSASNSEETGLVDGQGNCDSDADVVEVARNSKDGRSGVFIGDMETMECPRPRLLEAVVILERIEEPVSSFQTGETSQRPEPPPAAHQEEETGKDDDSIHSNSQAFIPSRVHTTHTDTQEPVDTAADPTDKPRHKKTPTEAVIARNVDTSPNNPFHCEICDFHFHSLIGLYHHQIKKHGIKFARARKELLLKEGSQIDEVERVETDKQTDPQTGLEGRRQLSICNADYSKHGSETAKCILSVTRSNENLDKRKVEQIQSTSNVKAITDSTFSIAEISQETTEDDHVQGNNICEKADSREIKDDVRLGSCVSYPHKIKLKVFKCGWCPAEFLLKSRLKAHTVKHTKLNSSNCDICGKKFDNIASLNRHKIRHSGKVMHHTCESCDRTFQTLRLLKDHQTAEHGRDNDKTDVSPKTMKTESEADVLLDSADKSVKEQVEMRNERSRSEEDCRIVTHPDTPVSVSQTCQPASSPNLNTKVTHRCRVCSLSFPCRRSFAQHMLHAHPDVEDVYSCAHCESSFKYGRDYNDHLVNVHFIYPFHCQKCGARFRYLTLLKEHLYRHQGLRPFMCDTCGKTYHRANQLHRHELTHLDERVYGCKVCGKRFLQLLHLVQHQRTHTGERPFVCEKCGKAFSQPSTLHNHMRTHQAKIECEDCGKHFTNNKRYLAEHQAVCKKVYVKRYGDYRDFICEKCGKDCKRRQGIYYHRKVGCQGPNQTSRLEQSVDTDTDTDETFCQKCHTHFSSPQRLRSHLHKTCGRKTKMAVVDRKAAGYSVCRHCGAEFSTLRSCQYHMYTQCVERRKRLADVTFVDPDTPGYCVCRHCGKAFASKSRRKYHVMRKCVQRAEVKQTLCLKGK